MSVGQDKTEMDGVVARDNMLFEVELNNSIRKFLQLLESFGILRDLPSTFMRDACRSQGLYAGCIGSFSPKAEGVRGICGQQPFVIFT